MPPMHARSTTVHGDPRSVAAAVTVVRDEIAPEVTAMPGCVGLSLLADSGSGVCIVTTSWLDEAVMHASRDGVAAAAARTAEVLGGRPELQEWEIAAMHRVLEAPPAARSRVTWLRSGPGAVDRAVDAVRLSLMPKLDDLPGFCSVSVMVRRSEGLAVATVSYDGEASLAQSRDGARDFQESFAPSLGIEVLDSAEFDVPIAHLRVPETT